jgi:hypothetical protein
MGTVQILVYAGFGLILMAAWVKYLVFDREDKPERQAQPSVRESTHFQQAPPSHLKRVRMALIDIQGDEESGEPAEIIEAEPVTTMLVKRHPSIGQVQRVA